MTHLSALLCCRYVIWYLVLREVHAMSSGVRHMSRKRRSLVIAPSMQPYIPHECQQLQLALVVYIFVLMWNGCASRARVYPPITQYDTDTFSVACAGSPSPSLWQPRSASPPWPCSYLSPVTRRAPVLCPRLPLCSYWVRAVPP